MRLFKGKLNIDFMGKRHFAIALSGVMIAVAIGSLIFRGLSLGIDFTGGTLIEVDYPQPAIDRGRLPAACDAGDSPFNAVGCRL